MINSPLYVQDIRFRAALELEYRRRLRASTLLDFVPRLTPRFFRPDHLAPVAQTIEAAATAPQRMLLSVPPQHGKTELISHGFVWHMQRDPTRRHAYVSYQAERAEEVSQTIYRLAHDAGLRPKGSQSRWYLPEGGCLYAVGIEGGITGKPVTGLLVVDDPHKNRSDAESQAMRDMVGREFTASIVSRVHQTTSVIVVHTRWHTDDLIGRLEDERKPDGSRKWQYINLPALDDEGRALCPRLKPVELLDEARLGNEYDWWSLYMGQPRPRGGAVFRDVYYYDELPRQYRVVVGVDLAYTAKTHSDFCVAVVLAEHDGCYYVLDVRREQSDPPTFAAHLRSLKAAYPGARMRWDTSTTERGLADLLRKESGIPLFGELATTDKFVRAQPAAAAWNDGRILLPRSGGWLEAFTAEVGSFTGIGDRHDDQVDALSSAFAALQGTSGIPMRPVKTKLEPFGGNPFRPTGTVKW